MIREPDDTGSQPPHAGPLHSPVVRAVAVSVALWAALLGSLTVARYDGDPRAFLCLGARFDHPPALAGAPRTSPWGYDGQFYGILATDPLLLDPDTARALDTPSYRARRILAPLAASILVLGDSEAAPFVYLGLTWLLGLAGVGLLAHWLHSAGRSPWLALAYAASGGVVVSFVRGTPDAAATTLVLAGIWWLRSPRRAGAPAAFTAAVLTRETTLLAALAAAIATAAEGRWRRAAVLAGVPLAAIAAWVGLLGLRFGFGSGGGLRNFAVPFSGAVERIVMLATGRLSGVEALGLLSVLATLAAAVVLLARGERDPVTLALASFVLLGAILGPAVWAEVYASLRVLGMLPALSLICLGGPAFRGRTVLLLAGPTLSAVAGLILVRIELIPMIPALGNLKGLAAAVLAWIL